MKTGEMIIELNENPHKKFKATWVSGEEIVAYVKGRHCINEGCYEDVIVVEFRNGNIEILIISNLMKKMKWEEVREPVDFMTAFKAFREGKIIYVLDGELASGKFTYFPENPNENPQAFSENDIANGEWYIKY